MLIYEIIDKKVEPKFRFNFHFLWLGVFIIFSLLSSNNGGTGSSGKYDWLAGLLALFLIITSLFEHYFEARLFKIIGTVSIQKESFTIRKGAYVKTYTFSDIQEIRYGRKYKRKAYKIEFDDILLYLKMDQKAQQELESFLEKNILSELQIEGEIESINLK